MLSSSGMMPAWLKTGSRQDEIRVAVPQSYSASCKELQRDTYKPSTQATHSLDRSSKGMMLPLVTPTHVCTYSMYDSRSVNNMVVDRLDDWTLILRLLIFCLL